jgi:SAM-dependent methyltransferase
LLLDSYVHRDVLALLKRYRESEEFRDTAALARANAPYVRTMLDVGGSNGVMATAFALEGFHVDVVEPSDDDIVGTRAAERLLAEASTFEPTVRERLRIHHTSIESFETADRFDFILCRQVVHHFEDPVVALTKISRFLNPKGVVLLIREHVVDDAEELERFLEQHPLNRYYKGEHAYTLEQYRQIALNAGFKVTRVLSFKDSPINYFPHPVEVIARFSERDIAGRPYSFVLHSAASSE